MTGSTHTIAHGAGFHVWTNAGLWAFRRAPYADDNKPAIELHSVHTTIGEFSEGVRCDTGQRVKLWTKHAMPIEAPIILPRS